MTTQVRLYKYDVIVYRGDQPALYQTIAATSPGAVDRVRYWLEQCPEFRGVAVEKHRPATPMRASTQALLPSLYPVVVGLPVNPFSWE